MRTTGSEAKVFATAKTFASEGFDEVLDESFPVQQNDRKVGVLLLYVPNPLAKQSIIAIASERRLLVSAFSKALKRLNDFLRWRC